jgi:hypothetical protein
MPLRNRLAPRAANHPRTTLVQLVPVRLLLLASLNLYTFPEALPELL